MEITLTIDEKKMQGWIHDVALNVDIFRYCRWLRHLDGGNGLFLAWNVWEDSGKIPSKRSLSGWRKGKQIPPHVYVINEDVATRAYIEGVKRWGVDWYEHSDGNSYDTIMQVALLGDELYG